MKRRTNPQKHRRRERPAPRPDFNALLFAHVTSHCPEHITTRDGQRAVTTEGVISYLEAVAKGESPGDPAFARETIKLLKNAKP